MKKNYLLVLWMSFLSILLLGLMFWAIFYVIDVQQKISIIGIVAVISAAVTSVLTVSINNKRAKEREYDLHILKEKQKVFEHFYTAYFEMLNGIRKGKKGITNKVTEEMMFFKKGLMNWGSERLIKKYLEFDTKLIESQGQQDKFNIFKEGDDFVKELRKELGYKDSGRINVMSIILTPEARKELQMKGLIN